jgi:hypothetical protein
MTASAYAIVGYAIYVASSPFTIEWPCSPRLHAYNPVAPQFRHRSPTVASPDPRRSPLDPDRGDYGEGPARPAGCSSAALEELGDRAFGGHLNNLALNAKAAAVLKKLS